MDVCPPSPSVNGLEIEMSPPGVSMFSPHANDLWKWAPKTAEVREIPVRRRRLSRIDQHMDMGDKQL